jgi:hypothetical protein
MPVTLRSGLMAATRPRFKLGWNRSYPSSYDIIVWFKRHYRQHLVRFAQHSCSICTNIVVLFVWHHCSICTTSLSIVRHHCLICTSPLFDTTIQHHCLTLLFVWCGTAARHRCSTDTVVRSTQLFNWYEIMARNVSQRLCWNQSLNNWLQSCLT